MTGALACAVALTLAAEPAGADAWPLVTKAAALASAAPSSPLLERVGQRRRDVLLDDEIAASLDAVRAAGPALDALDAALAAPACSLPKDAATLGPASIRTLALADHALAAAIVDAADGKPKRALASVGRAADLAALVARCKRPTLLSFATALGVADHARSVAWLLAEHRLVDAAGLAAMAAGLAPVTLPAAMERAVDGEKALLRHALTLDEQRAIADLGARLDASAKDQAALVAAARDFDHIARTERDVDVRCEPASAPDRYTVTRAVAAVLERRSPDSLAQDSIIGPALDGSGALVVNAGPIARSCGFLSGDIVVEVNGVPTRQLDRAFAEIPRQVAKDGHAAIRALRAGSVAEWRVDVEAPPRAP